MKQHLYILFVATLLFACKKTPKSTANVLESNLEYAKSFHMHQEGDIRYISVTKAWPESTKTFHYMLVPKGKDIVSPGKDTLLIRTPIEKVVVMSTTNIPVLEALEQTNSLVGFPNTNYISSEVTRKRIELGAVKDLGSFGNLNLELLLQSKPDLVVGFSVNGNNSTYQKIQQYGIPVVLDGSWTEAHPLGRAEWIKFMGAFYQQNQEAKAVFDTIKTNYHTAKKVAQTATKRPTALSGSMFKDVWHVPGGNSFAAQILKDAHINYLWKDTPNTGSLPLSIEAVLDKAKDADLWISAGSFTNKAKMAATNQAYTVFSAFENNAIYSFSHKKGATGGLLYYELGPLRPDWILKDIIQIAHPELLPNYEPFFFKALD